MPETREDERANSSVTRAWEGRFRAFIFALSEHEGDANYDRARVEFTAFWVKWNNNKEGMCTRSNIQFLGNEWLELCMLLGANSMLKEFPDWSFIVTQFQLLVLLRELRP
jgi:hypothetical protein